MGRACPRRRQGAEAGSPVPQRRRTALIGCCVTSVLDAVAVGLGSPQFIRICLGLLVVFVVPGYSLVCAVVAERQLKDIELVVATVGLSLSMAIVAAVALAATPLGLTGEDLALTLALCTLGFATIGIARLGHVRPQARASAGKEEGLKA